MKRNVRELSIERKLTMIFRRRKKAPVVKYSYDTRFATELANNGRIVDALADAEIAFESWTTYPAMKTCDMIKKLPSQCPASMLKEERIVGRLRNKYKNIARFNLEMWKHMKSNMGKVNQDELSFSLQSILTGGMSGTTKTVRMCPPIKDLLTQTLVVKCPVDMHFAKGKMKEMYDGMLPFVENLDDDDSWHWTSPATHLHSRADPFGEFHPKDQFCYGEESQMNGWSNLKINTGLHLDMPDHVTAVQHQPIFHNINLPMTVIPGIFNFPTNKGASIIPNFFISPSQEDFILNKGDALAYITFSEPVKFELDEKGSDYLIKFSFDSPQLSWRNLAKKLRYDGKD